jgi:hypothetical protein
VRCRRDKNADMLLLLSSDIDSDDIQVFIPVSLYTYISLNLPCFMSLDIQVEDNKLLVTPLVLSGLDFL